MPPKNSHKSNQIFTFEVWMDIPRRKTKPWREIAIRADCSMYELAITILTAFDFELDHCFGFYSNLENPFASEEMYEAFVDLGECTNFHSKSVEQTQMQAVFDTPEKELLMLFDYGVNWRFHLKLSGSDTADPFASKAVVFNSYGRAPKQYSKG